MSVTDEMFEKLHKGWDGLKTHCPNCGQTNNSYREECQGCGGGIPLVSLAPNYSIGLSLMSTVAVKYLSTTSFIK